MWEQMRALRESGVTIILTTHYIEEAQEMADRIGVINHGEIVVVEEKNELMRKLGKKQLTLNLTQPIDAVPEGIPGLRLTGDKMNLEYLYDTSASNNSVAQLLKRLGERGIEFRDLSTQESSLEEIFVNLVKGKP